MAHWFSPCSSVRVAKLQALIMSFLRFKICLFAAWYVPFCILKGILLPSERYPFAVWNVSFRMLKDGFSAARRCLFLYFSVVVFLLTVHIRSYCLFHVFLYVKHINSLPLTPFPDFDRYVFLLISAGSWLLVILLLILVDFNTKKVLLKTRHSSQCGLTRWMSAW